MNRKLFVLAMCAVASVLMVAPAATAADYPSKPITVYLPLSAGGTTDVFVRTITPHMEKALGQKMVLINKPGSCGTVAISTLSKAKPDGYTMSWANLPTLVRSSTSSTLRSFWSSGLQVI